jgi:hypothetical protein
MDRTPEQIIGKDALMQLIFEGYAVVRHDATCGMITAMLAADGQHAVSLVSPKREHMLKLWEAGVDWKPRAPGESI